MGSMGMSTDQKMQDTHGKESNEQGGDRWPTQADLFMDLGQDVREREIEECASRKGEDPGCEILQDDRPVQEKIEERSQRDRQREEEEERKGRMSTVACVNQKGAERQGRRDLVRDDGKEDDGADTCFERRAQGHPIEQRVGRETQKRDDAQRRVVMDFAAPLWNVADLPSDETLQDEHRERAYQNASKGLGLSEVQDLGDHLKKRGTQHHASGECEEELRVASAVGMNQKNGSTTAEDDQDDDE